MCDATNLGKPSERSYLNRVLNIEKKVKAKAKGRKGIKLALQSKINSAIVPTCI